MSDATIRRELSKMFAAIEAAAAARKRLKDAARSRKPKTKQRDREAQHGSR